MSSVQMSVGACHPAFSPQGEELFFQTPVAGRWQIWRTPLRTNGRAEPILTQPGISCTAPSAGASDLYHLRSMLGYKTNFGPDRSLTLWKCAGDGGRQQRVSPEGLSVSSVVASPRVPGRVLYLALDQGAEQHNALYLQVEAGDPRVVFRDSAEEQVAAVDWGPTESTVLLLLNSRAADRESTEVVMLDMSTGMRSDLPVQNKIRQTLGPRGQLLIHDMALAPDRHRLAIGLALTDSTSASTNEIVILDLGNGACTRLLTLDIRDGSGHLAWSPDGKLLAVEVLGGRADLFLWEPASSSELKGPA
jgi:Tol biopolymer transport system component